MLKKILNRRSDVDCKAIEVELKEHVESRCDGVILSEVLPEGIIGDIDNAFTMGRNLLLFKNIDEAVTDLKTELQSKADFVKTKFGKAFLYWYNFPQVTMNGDLLSVRANFEISNKIPEPKYGVGDRVWAMRHNKPSERIVYGVTTFIAGSGNTIMVTYATFSNGHVTDLMKRNLQFDIMEESIFPTKQALIESL